MKMQKALAAYGTEAFKQELIGSVQSLEKAQLPLQQALCNSSYVSDSDFKVIVLNVTEQAVCLQVKIGVFYTGVIAGSCCADDPTPLCEENEYCELDVKIDRLTAEAEVSLL